MAKGVTYFLERISKNRYSSNSPQFQCFVSSREFLKCHFLTFCVHQRLLNGSYSRTSLLSSFQFLWIFSSCFQVIDKCRNSMSELTLHVGKNRSSSKKIFLTFSRGKAKKKTKKVSCPKNLARLFLGVVSHLPQSL